MVIRHHRCHDGVLPKVKYSPDSRAWTKSSSLASPPRAWIQSAQRWRDRRGWPRSGRDYWHSRSGPKPHCPELFRCGGSRMASRRMGLCMKFNWRRLRYSWRPAPMMWRGVLAILTSSQIQRHPDEYDSQTHSTRHRRILGHGQIHRKTADRRWLSGLCRGTQHRQDGRSCPAWRGPAADGYLEGR